MLEIVRRPLVPDDLHELKFDSYGKIEEFLDRYAKLDIPKDNPVTFLEQLTTMPNAWFVEAGDMGLYYLANIQPRLDAQFYMLFWDKALTADRRECARIVLKRAFELFQLRRCTSLVDATNIPLRKTVEKIGFTHEGTIRQSLVVDGEYHDACILGLLTEEMTWPVLRPTSLA